MSINEYMNCGASQAAYSSDVKKENWESSEWMILTHRERIYKPHTCSLSYNTFFSQACSQQIIKVTNIVVQGNLKRTKVLIILRLCRAIYAAEKRRHSQ